MAPESSTVPLRRASRRGVAANAALLRSFFDKADPEGVLSPAEREVKAAALRREYFGASMRRARLAKERAGIPTEPASKDALEALRRRVKALERIVGLAAVGDMLDV